MSVTVAISHAGVKTKEDIRGVGTGQIWADVGKYGADELRVISVLSSVLLALQYRYNDTSLPSKNLSRASFH